MANSERARRNAEAERDELIEDTANASSLKYVIIKIYNYKESRMLYVVIIFYISNSDKVGWMRKSDLRVALVN